MVFVVFVIVRSEACIKESNYRFFFYIQCFAKNVNTIIYIVYYWFVSECSIIMRGVR